VNKTNLKFLPVADPADLEKLWTLQYKEFPELLKKYAPPPPGTLRSFEEPRLREIRNVEAVSFRLLMLTSLRAHGEAFLKQSGVVLPGLQDEKPSEALFKAFATVPMIDVVHHHRVGDPPHEGWPVDLEELARLISKSE
jgi:hypothetical protein